MAVGKEPTTKKPRSPRFQNGLAKVGRVYHYCFTVDKVQYKGSTYTGDKDQAKAILEAKKKEVAAARFGVGVTIKGAGATLREIYGKWCKLNAYPILAHSTHRMMRLTVETHFASMLDTPAAMITETCIQEWRAEYLASTGTRDMPKGGKCLTNHGEASANARIANLHSLLKFGVEHKMLRAVAFNWNPLPIDPMPKSVLWPEQVAQFLDYVDRLRGPRGQSAPIVIRLMLALGLRASEACLATWERLDWRRGVYTVADVMLDIEGRTDGRLRKARVKTKTKRNREVPLPKWLIPFLEALWVARGQPANGFIACTPEGKSHAPTNGVGKKVIRKAGEKVGAQGLTPHALRRTFATGHSEKGTRLELIAQMLGHRSTKTTVDNYIVPRHVNLQEAQDALGEFYGFKCDISATNIQRLIKPLKTKEL